MTCLPIELPAWHSRLVLRSSSYTCNFTILPLWELYRPDVDPPRLTEWYLPSNFREKKKGPVSSELDFAATSTGCGTHDLRLPLLLESLHTQILALQSTTISSTCKLYQSPRTNFRMCFCIRKLAWTFVLDHSLLRFVCACHACKCNCRSSFLREKANVQQWLTDVNMRTCMILPWYSCSNIMERCSCASLALASGSGIPCFSSQPDSRNFWTSIRATDWSTISSCSISRCWHTRVQAAKWVFQAKDKSLVRIRIFKTKQMRTCLLNSWCVRTNKESQGGPPDSLTLQVLLWVPTFLLCELHLNAMHPHTVSLHSCN